MGYCNRFSRFQLTLTLAVLVIVNVVQSAVAADDAVEKARLETMLAAGDTGMIVQVFKRHPGRTLPFIDSYLESGLAMNEKGEAPMKAIDSFRTGIRFAELADKAFGGTTFADYANSFASWSPSEQKSFREGQREYKAGAKEEDANKALLHLRKSLALARPLGDAWGQAMAQQAIAEKLIAKDDVPGAIIAGSAAAELNGMLKLNEDALQSLLLVATAGNKQGAARERLSPLMQAWTIVTQDPSIDRELRAKVRDEYAAALEAAGATTQAEAIRRTAEQD